MFGVRPTLEINGKRKYKSWCGAVFSLLTGLVVFIYTAYKMAEAFTDKSNPSGFLLTFNTDTGGLIYQTINVTAIANMTQMVGTPPVPTSVLVPVIVPMQEKSTLIAILDAMGFIGGMIVMLQAVFGIFANCVNKRLYLS